MDSSAAGRGCSGVERSVKQSEPHNLHIDQLADTVDHGWQRSRETLGDRSVLSHAKVLNAGGSGPAPGSLFIVSPQLTPVREAFVELPSSPRAVASIATLHELLAIELGGMQRS